MQSRQRRSLPSPLHVAAFASLLLLCSVVAGQEPESPDEIRGRAAPVDLSRIGASDLLWKSPDGLVPLPMGGLEIELTVTGVMVHGRISQWFHNPTDEVIEALYVFPMPEQAAVHHMELVIGERRIVSRIEERVQARRIYEQAKQSGKKAGLVNQQRPNLFTSEVANINPGEAIALTLEYYQELDYVDGSYALAFPLTFTPRFFPDAMKSGPAGASSVPMQSARAWAPDAGDVGDAMFANLAIGCAPFIDSAHPAAPYASITVHLDLGYPAKTIVSDSHAIQVTSEADRRIVRPATGVVVAGRDFLLRWEPRLGDEPRAVIFTEERQDGQYALMMLMPPEPGSTAGWGLPTETMFLIDVSSSMSGTSIRQARQALLSALDRLRPEDRFNIIRFNSDHDAFRNAFQQAEPANLDLARAWVRGLRAGGGTNIYPALMGGIAMLGESTSTRAQRLVFLTDGAVGNEQQLLAAVQERLGDTRLHTIGIGNAPNRHLMRKLAERGRGLCEFIPGGVDARNRITEFFERLERPVLTDVELVWDGIDVAEVYPARVPDLYAGEPLLLSVKVDGEFPAGRLSLGGHTRSGWLETTLSTVDGRAVGSGIALRWARARVASLMDDLAEGRDAAAVREDVLDVALNFGLVTRYTSLVAVDDVATAQGEARPAHMAGALPQGGTDGPLRLTLGLALSIVGLVLALVLLRIEG